MLTESLEPTALFGYTVTVVGLVFTTWILFRDEPAPSNANYLTHLLGAVFMWLVVTLVFGIVFYLGCSIAVLLYSHFGAHIYSLIGVLAWIGIIVFVVRN